MAEKESFPTDYINVVMDFNSFSQKEYAIEFFNALRDFVILLDEAERKVFNRSNISKRTKLDWEEELETRAEELGEYIIQAKRYNLWKGQSN